MIADLSQDPTVHGILLQHPVPGHIDERAAFEAIVPEKDVDGVTMHSFAAMAFGDPGFASCTPGGILRLLDVYDVDPTWHACGRDRAQSDPREARRHVVAGAQRDGDVLPLSHRAAPRDRAARASSSSPRSASPEFVRGDWIASGAVVIDAGYNEGNVGDVAFAEAVGHVGLITPVPGGVGPMTIAVLLDQTVDAAFLLLRR